MRKFFVFLLLLIFSLVVPFSTFAQDETQGEQCKCQNPRYEPVENAKLYEHVFSGRVTKITKTNVQNRISFQRIKTYKGYQTDQIEVVTPIDTDPCAVDFKAGKEYLVYGKMDKDGYMHTDYCAQTKLLENAGDDEAALAKASKTAKATESKESAISKALAPANGSPAILGTILFSAAVLILGVGVGVTGVSNKEKRG